MVDIHSHILPRFDDGAKNIEETLDMVKIAKKEGFSKIIATPHYIEGAYITNKEKLVDTIAMVNEVLKEKSIDMEILPGNEVYISHNLPQLLKNKEILTLNNGPYVLLELPMGDIPMYTEDILYEVRLLGYKPVIAHPERYVKIMENPNYLKFLIEQGNYVQMNSLSITGGFGERVKKTAEILLRHRMVHFIGTDAHSPRTRAPKISYALDQMREWIGNEAVYNMVQNGIKLTKGEEVYIPQPLHYVQNKGFAGKVRSLFAFEKKRVYG